MITPNICQLSQNALANPCPRFMMQLVEAITDMLTGNGIQPSRQNIINYIPEVILEKENFLIDFAIDHVLDGTQVEA